MLETLFDFEANSLFELIPVLDRSYSYNEIMQFEMNPFYKDFVSAELKWRLLDSFIPFVKCKNIQSENSIEEMIENFLSYSIEYAFFGSDELREILKTAVRYKVNSCFQSIELLTMHLFTNSYTISKLEFLVKKEFFPKDSIAYDVLSSIYNQYSSLDDFSLINKGNLRKFVEKYSADLIENSSKLGSKLDTIRAYLFNFNKELNVANLSILLMDLGLGYLSDRLRVDYNDEYAPTNDEIYALLDNDVVTNTINAVDIEPLYDDIVDYDINDELVETEIEELSKEQFFPNDDIEVIDKIIDDINLETNIKSNRDVEELVDMDTAANEARIFDEGMTIGNIEDSQMDNSVDISNTSAIDGNTNISDSIDNELKLMKDILNI